MTGSLDNNEISLALGTSVPEEKQSLEFDEVPIIHCSLCLKSYFVV